MILLKFGNHKLPDDTGIINMCSASECPSNQLGLCEVINNNIKCYALRDEQTYPNVKQYRDRQREYWRNTPAYEIGRDLLTKINRRRKETKYIRFNESGDFHDQEDVDKLSVVSKSIESLGIIVYGYTARSDLDFSNASFLVKGSGHNRGNNGRTMVITKHDNVPEGYIVCPGSCKKCNLCKIKVPHNIAFIKH